MMRNPQAFINQMMNNNQIMQNPIARNAFEMMRNNDSKGLEELARNICAEKGIDPDEALKQVKQRFGV